MGDILAVVVLVAVFNLISDVFANASKYTSLKIVIKEIKNFGFSLGKSKSKSRLDFRGLYLYTGGVLLHGEWGTRQLCSPSIIFHNITSIAHNHHTNICPVLNINSQGSSTGGG